MPNELTPARLAKLAEQLGLFKPKICKHGYSRPHELVYTGKGICSEQTIEEPQPDLLSDTGFSLMVGAALRMGLALSAFMQDGVVRVSVRTVRYAGVATDPDYRVALALALGDFFDKGGAR